MSGAPTSRVSEASVLALSRRLHVPATTESRAAVVEHQLATAIAIGLLQPGERLPSETVMAQVFGVSALTFRQSLDRLRLRALVRTRPGRGGGTVIDPAPGALHQLSQETLGTASMMEIADAGTLLAGSLAHCARVAAQRCDRFDHETLRTALRALVEARDPVARRRAATLLVVTTASVTCSEQLLEQMIPAVSRFQSWLWFDPAGSHLTTAHAVAMVEAIGRSDAAGAAQAATEHVGELTELLLSQRIALYRERGATPADGASPEDETGSRWAELGRRIRAVHAGLERAAESTTGLTPPSRAGLGSPGQVVAALQAVVLDEPDLVRGAGLAYAPNLIADAPLWMDWWDSGDDHELTFKRHVFNVASMQYYNYAAMPWFTQPRERRAFSLHGPYLDRGGIERITVTASLPVTTQGFAGSVVGADLRVGAIEGILLAGAGAPVEPWVLATGNGRVLASTVPTSWPGSAAPASLVESPTLTVEPELRAAGWRLLIAE